MGHIAKACRGHKEGGYGKETRHLECCNALKHETCTDSSALKQQGRHVCSAPQHVDQSNAPQHVDQSNSPQHLDQSNAQNLRSNGDCIQPQPHSSREDYGLPKRSMVDAVKNTWDIGGADLFAMDTGKVDNDIVKPYYVYVSVNGTRAKMEVDTGAAVSLISETLLKQRFKGVKLSPANCVLKNYSEESLQLLGKSTAKVKCKERSERLELLVVKGRGPALMGRDWISKLKLDWSRVNRVAPDTVDVCARHVSVFKPDLGKLTGIKARLHVVPDAVPKFCKPRNGPYALREAVERELAKLEAEGFISPNYYSK